MICLRMKSSTIVERTPRQTREAGGIGDERSHLRKGGRSVGRWRCSKHYRGARACESVASRTLLEIPLQSIFAQWSIAVRGRFDLWWRATRYHSHRRTTFRIHLHHEAARAAHTRASSLLATGICNRLVAPVADPCGLGRSLHRDASRCMLNFPAPRATLNAPPSGQTMLASAPPGQQPTLRHVDMEHLLLSHRSHSPVRHRVTNGTPCVTRRGPTRPPPLPRSRNLVASKSIDVAAASGPPPRPPRAPPSDALEHRRDATAIP